MRARAAAAGFPETTRPGRRASLADEFGGFFHLAFDFFDFDEMRGIESKRGIVTVAFMCAEAAVGDGFAPAFHCSGIPEFGEIPVVFTKVCDGVENLAT